MLYFPQFNMCVFAENISESAISYRLKSIETLRRLLRSLEGVSQGYLSNQSGRKRLLLIGQANFAHHVLNELSGLGSLIDEELHHLIDEFWVLRSPIGEVSRIFPEIPADKFKQMDAEQESILNRALEENFFVIKYEDSFVPEHLRSRIIRTSLESLEEEKRMSIIDDYCEHKTVIWCSVKCGDRTITNQTTALAKILTKVAQTVEKPMVLLDGISFPIDIPKYQGGRIYRTEFLKEHDRVIKQIQAELESKGVPSRNLNGNTLTEAIFRASKADYYIVHWGSIQHKVGWFAQCRGTVHANTSVLSRRYRKLAECHVRGDNTPSFLPAKFVRDNDTEFNDYRPRGRAGLENYLLDADKVAKYLIKDIKRSSIPR